MKSILFLILVAGILTNAPLPVFAQAFSQYELEKKIPIPGNAGYDYLSIDTIARRIYVSHGTSVEVIDLVTDQLIGSIDSLSGVHGITVAAAFHKGFISDGKANSVVVFDLTTLQVIKTIHITGRDPDAILFDPFSGRVFTFNGDSGDASVIDAATMEQMGRVSLGGTPEFAVADGSGKIFNNLEDKNILNVIDSKSLQVINTFPLDPCVGPTGLALDKKNQRLFTVCRKNKGMTVVDAQSGRIITTVPIGSGVDAVTYDEAGGLIFCSNGDGTATIIRQETPDSYQVVQTLSTQWKAKTHAFDPQTRKLYLSSFDMEAGTKNRVPNSFKILIYKPKA
jgi:DNA-binding beta-propeller fold protein YncE